VDRQVQGIVIQGDRAGSREGRDNGTGGHAGRRRSLPGPGDPGEAGWPAALDSGDRPGGAKAAYGKPCWFGKPAYGNPPTANLPLLTKPRFGASPTFGSRPGSEVARRRLQTAAGIASFAVSRALVGKPALWPAVLRRQATFRTGLPSGEPSSVAGRPLVAGIVWRRPLPPLIGPHAAAGSPPHLLSGPGRERCSEPKRCNSDRFGGNRRGHGLGPPIQALAAWKPSGPIHRNLVHA